MAEGKIIKFDPKRKKPKDNEKSTIDLDHPRVVFFTVVSRNIFSGIIKTFLAFIRFILAGAIGVPLGGIWLYGKDQTFPQFVDYVQSQWPIIIMLSLVGVFLMWIFRYRNMMPWHVLDNNGAIIPLRNLWKGHA